MARWFGRRRETTVEKVHAEPQETEAPPRPAPEPEVVSPGQAHEDEWIEENAGLIAALREAGHLPAFTTEMITLGAGIGQGWDTSMHCERCGKRYRGPFLDPWRGLSPKRTCTG